MSPEDLGDFWDGVFVATIVLMVVAAIGYAQLTRFGVL
jgi:hypothetical protein